MSFLELMVSVNGGQLTSDVNHKPTDTHQFLNFKSCHPLHVKKAIPYCQAIRLKPTHNSEDV